MALLVVVAAIIRWVDLWTIPIFTDEGDEIGLALRILRDGARPLTNDDPYLGPLFNYLLAGWFWIFGTSPWQPRLLMLALGAATVIPTYLLARELAVAVGASQGRARLAGALAGSLLAVNAGHVYVVSHVAWGNCLTPLLTTLAAWQLARAARPSRADDSSPSMTTDRRSAGVALVLGCAAFGLAFQTHPSVTALLPGASLFVLWRRWRWLLSPWPYLGAGAMVAAQTPTLIFIGRYGLSTWLDAIREKQEMYERDGALGLPEIVERFKQAVYTLGASLGGLLNDRDTPLPPIWHPALVLALILGILALGWLVWRRQLLVPLVVLSGLALLPLVNGKYAPLVSNVRYLEPLTIILMASVAAWAACTVGSVLRLRRLMAPSTLPLAALLALTLGSVVSLAAFSIAAHRDGRTNTRLLASLAVLEAAYRPGDVVTVDRAMYRDWTLTEGRLMRVFDSWLEVRAIPRRIVDVEDGGRLRTDLATRGGLTVLARRTVPAVARAYQLDELATDATIDAPTGTGYSVVRLRRAGD